MSNTSPFTFAVRTAAAAPVVEHSATRTPSFVHPWDNFGDLLAAIRTAGSDPFATFDIPASYWPWYMANGGAMAARVKPENLAEPNWWKQIVRVRWNHYLDTLPAEDRKRFVLTMIDRKGGADGSEASLGVWVRRVDQPAGTVPPAEQPAG